MQTATSETESKSLDLSICVHHFTLREPCPKGQGIGLNAIFRVILASEMSILTLRLSLWPSGQNLGISNNTYSSCRHAHLPRRNPTC